MNRVKKIILLLIVSILVFAQPVFAAQSAIQVRSNKASADFPKKVTFALNASSPVKIDKITIKYGLVSYDCHKLFTFSQPVTFEPASYASVQWDWNFTFLVPLMTGMQIWWLWEIRDESGATLTTEMQTLTVTGTGEELKWKVMEKDHITLLWTDRPESTARSWMDIAERALERLSNQAGIESPRHVQIVVYSDLEDMHDALPLAAEWTGGIAMPSYGLVLITIPTGAQFRWAQNVIQHELAHLVVDMRMDRCNGHKLPVWLNEGIAQYAEGPLPASQRALAIEAMAEDRLPGLPTLADRFPRESDEATLAYAYSNVIFNYMVDTFGHDQLDALLEQIGQGEEIDAAMRPLYGYDTPGLEQAWRASLGFDDEPLQDFSTATPLPTRTPMPTVQLQPSVRKKTATPSLTPTAEPSPTATLTPTASPSPTSLPATVVAPEETVRQIPWNLALLVAGSLGLTGTLMLAGVGVWYWRRRLP